MSTFRIIEELKQLHAPSGVRISNGRLHTTCGHCDTGDPFVLPGDGWDGLYPCPTAEILERIKNDE